MNEAVFKGAAWRTESRRWIITPHSWAEASGSCDCGSRHMQIKRGRADRSGIVHKCWSNSGLRVQSGRIWVWKTDSRRHTDNQRFCRGLNQFGLWLRPQGSAVVSVVWVVSTFFWAAAAQSLARKRRMHKCTFGTVETCAIGTTPCQSHCGSDIMLSTWTSTHTKYKVDLLKKQQQRRLEGKVTRTKITRTLRTEEQKEPNTWIGNQDIWLVRFECDRGFVQSPSKLVLKLFYWFCFQGSFPDGSNCYLYTYAMHWIPVCIHPSIHLLLINKDSFGCRQESRGLLCRSAHVLNLMFNLILWNHFYYYYFV